MSLSARRVWIEIPIFAFIKNMDLVTLCEESVDWNSTAIEELKDLDVTLCEESVDWNRREAYTVLEVYRVTLCEESVDWNDP